MKTNAVLIICGNSLPCLVENFTWESWVPSNALEPIEVFQGGSMGVETQLDESWMRSLADCRAERIRERAEQNDPHHPLRRSKGEKARNRGRQV